MVRACMGAYNYPGVGACLGHYAGVHKFNFIKNKYKVSINNKKIDFEPGQLMFACKQWQYNGIITISRRKLIKKVSKVNITLQKEETAIILRLYNLTFEPY